MAFLHQCIDFHEFCEQCGQYICEECFPDHFDECEQPEDEDDDYDDGDYDW